MTQYIDKEIAKRAIAVGNVHNEEGIVFWNDDAPLCKIKRTDFGLDWPMKEDKQ